MKRFLIKLAGLVKGISILVLIVVSVLNSTLCYSQNKMISEVNIGGLSHTRLYHNLGRYLYFVNPDSTYFSESVDTFSYIIIRKNKVIKQGVIANGQISVSLQEIVKEGDIVTYYNFRCKRKDFMFINKRMSLTFVVPFHKWGRKE